MPKLAVIYYSMYGHVAKMADAVVEGAKKVEGVEVTLLQVAETLPQEVLTKMHAPPKRDNVPVVAAKDLAEYDGFLFGVPTRYGNMPAQWKTLMDATGQLWASGALYHKHAGIFTSTATQHGGQEVTITTMVPVLAAHGIIFVPLGYGPQYADLAQLTEVSGGSPLGAGTIAGGDGSRQPSEVELRLATSQGEQFAEVLARAHK